MKIHTYNAKRNSAPPLYDNVRNFRTRGFGLATSPNFNFCFQGHNWFLPSIFCGISQGPLRKIPRPRGVTIKDRCFGYFRNLSWFLEQVPPEICGNRVSHRQDISKMFSLKSLWNFPVPWGARFLIHLVYSISIYNIQHTFQAPKGVQKFKNHCLFHVQWKQIFHARKKSCQNHFMGPLSLNLQGKSWGYPILVSNFGTLRGN